MAESAASSYAAGFVGTLPAKVQEQAAAIVHEPPSTPVGQLATAFTSDFATKLAAGAIAGIPATPAIAGTLPGGVTVSDSGSAGYSIPISVPVGRNGLTPSLDLSYSNQSADGFLGQGWGLSLPPVIRKCDPWASVEVDDSAGLSFSDKTVAEAKQRLCYGDAPLVRVSSPTELDRDRLAPGKYRTVPDQFLEVEIPSSGSAIFVREKSGLVRTYSPFGEWWHRSVTHDRFGNAITYIYKGTGTCHEPEPIPDVDPDNIAAPSNAPCRIDYLQKDDPACIDHSGSGLCTNRHITFTYQHHPRGRVIFGPGGPLALDRLLKKITISGNGDGSGWSYDLAYENAKSTGRPLLKSVKLCENGGACLPATTFDYADRDWNDIPRFSQVASIDLGEAAFQVVAINVANLMYDLQKRGSWPTTPVALDLNGDGRDDSLWREGNSSGFTPAYRYALSQEGGGFAAPREVL